MTPEDGMPIERPYTTEAQSKEDFILLLFNSSCSAIVAITLFIHSGKVPTAMPPNTQQ